LTKIHFIINPIAGKGIQYLSMDLLQSIFNPENYTIEIKYSKYKKHATILTNQSITDGAQIIVACGGDGTINEVASCLIHTTIKLGIVPIGSGNGLASNLNIPRKIISSLHIIKQQKTIKIDVGSVNQKLFFSNAGVGFDATVIKNYESSNKRTLVGYIMACFTSFKEINNLKNLEIKINNSVFEINPFLVFISNSNELGYKFSLTPKASLQDGLLDIIIISKINKLKMLWFGLLVLINKPLLLKEAKYYQTNRFIVQNKAQNYFETQLDGEFSTIKDETLSIKINEKALNVISPTPVQIY
tara:strand:+ start:1369 stop:2271 length:903 start_codon:yes stop_codon:yes gene_type:complete